MFGYGTGNKGTFWTSPHTLAGEYLAGFQYPWQALDGIKELILTLGLRCRRRNMTSPPPGLGA